jgi:galactosylceramidase
MQNFPKKLAVQAKALLRGLAAFFWCLALAFAWPVLADQTVAVDGSAAGRRFEGVGAVSGGGATSVLLKDYPEPQRSQILDLLFRPNFGAAMSALLVEIPGDGNSTQGSELSHMHSRNDVNYRRGYEWWLIKEAKKRNPALALDGVAWGCPGWVGNNIFWSKDMCDYYVKWIQGLRSVYGLDLDAIGCRNEKGVDEGFAKMLRRTLDGNGLPKVRVHGFDNWEKTKWDWCADMNSDPELRRSVDIMSNHTLFEMPAPAAVKKLAADLDKPIWNTEEHVYKKDFDCEISLVQAFNQNHIASGATKVMCWYLETSFYPVEPFFDVTTIVAATPWNGHYTVNPALWGYAHYGQFVNVGWRYLEGACGDLSAGGSYVTLASGSNYSIIAETKGSRENQKVAFNVSGGLSAGKVCVWRSNARAQFSRQEDIVPGNGSFALTLEPDSIYSISTTSGQQKGAFESPSAAQAFPFPYFETFDHYSDPKLWGYLPHYTADICGGFEIAERPDGLGKCLRQVVDTKAQSWAPEWFPYTIVGDENWTDYEVSADVSLEHGGSVGILGRVGNTGGGYGCNPTGYYLRLDADGTCSLYASTQAKNGDPGRKLATGRTGALANNHWQNLKLQFAGSTITGFVDHRQILTASDGTYSKGLVGLLAGGEGDVRNTALFDNLIINPVNGPAPQPTAFPQDDHPMYPP